MSAEHQYIKPHTYFDMFPYKLMITKETTMSEKTPTKNEFVKKHVSWHTHQSASNT